MSYERQRAAALRMVNKYGTGGILEQTVSVPDDDMPWKSTTSLESTPISLVAFADDGVTFVDHNITGDVRLLTVVSEVTLNIAVGDAIKTAVNNYTVMLAKPLDPDLSGAILWAVLVQ